VRKVLQNFLLVGFNSTEYDLPMIQLALKGYTTEELKGASDDIIMRGMRARDFSEKHKIDRHSWNHIDLIQVAPLKGSLKIYAGRLHCQKMQDLPVDPDAAITAEEATQLAQYCLNDLDNTILLREELAGQIALRMELSEQYEQDLRSKSDAQTAERIIALEVKEITGVHPQRPQGLEGKSFKYQVPEYISYASPQLKALLDKIRAVDFVVGDNVPFFFLKNWRVRISSKGRNLPYWHLHSSETKVMHKADADTLLIDRDVAS